MQMIALDDLVHSEGSIFKCTMPYSPIISAAIPVYISGFVATLALSMTCLLDSHSRIRKALAICGTILVVFSCAFEILVAMLVLFVFLDEPRISRLDTQDWVVLGVGAARGILFLIGTVLLVVSLPAGVDSKSRKDISKPK